MKKFFKILGIILAIILAFVLLAGLFAPKGSVRYEKNIVIDAPKDSIWKHVSTLRAMDVWSPWNAYDSSMQKTFTGEDGTVGATFSWKGNKEVGSGSQTISRVNAPNLIDVQLSFKEPMQNEAKSFIKLKAAGKNSTIVTWGMECSMPYPLNAMQLFCNMDKMIGKDFGKGLENLKQISESNAK